MINKALALGLVVSLVLLGVLGWIEHRALRRDLAAVWRHLAGPSSSAGVAPMAKGEVFIVVDPNEDAHAISPLIYGVAKRDPSAVLGLGATINRWGGNPSSRYNWVIGHAWNAGSDWEFRNLNYGTQGGSESDRFVTGDRSEAMASIITVPAVGWVARSDKNSDQSIDVPDDGGPAVSAAGAIAGYDPAANRLRTSVISLPRKGAPFVLDPDPASKVVYQDEWVNHLRSVFGPANSGGVAFYAIDNEPMLWSQTHRDVHPARVGYDELGRVFVDYATAVKAVDPTAQVLGPESCCWTDYWDSELDRGKDNFATQPDRDAHGDTPLIPWFLRTVQQHDAATGARTLDVLTVHFYPEASKVATDASNPDLDALRLRTTRALWDPSYVDESWIKQPVDLIPRLQQWVASGYAGTKIGITEYNFGGGNSPSAGLAEAEALGIFGREGIYMATYWTAPKPNSPAWFAFRMYRNVDGKHAGFAGESIQATSSASGTVSAYASKDPGWVTVMLINKDLQSAHSAGVNLRKVTASGSAQRYQYSAEDPSSIVRLADTDASSSTSLELPAASITLLRVPVAH